MSVTVQANVYTPWPHYYARRSKKKSPVLLNPWDVASTASTWRNPRKISTRLPTIDSRPLQITEWGRCPLALPQKLRPPRQSRQRPEGLLPWPRTSRTNSETMTIQTRLQTRPLVQVRPLKQPQSSLLLSYAWLFISYEHYLFINYHPRNSLQFCPSNNPPVSWSPYMFEYRKDFESRVYCCSKTSLLYFSTAYKNQKHCFSIILYRHLSFLFKHSRIFYIYRK